ncbi:glycerol kinase GlpK [Planctobacterium marinum]|uniref:Glycerol kinase n=1 Tax=Planctobacterium marinum TaxID=1631968 RepID=A0AA48KQZ7_9ALTE|nr:glycerol kinase 1 [Planctobacterium marinum]
MSFENCILAIDQGTTSTRAIVFSETGKIICSAQQEFTQHYPDDGWVEHDPEEIWSGTLKVCREALSEGKTLGARVVTIGITNQRETTLVWDKKTGKAIYNAIVWQDRRTAAVCDKLRTDATLELVQSKSGLLLDPYFSATKVAWVLDNVEGARQRANDGELAFGTIDSFLIWRLTGGKEHLTDVTNASRTNLFNINSLCWDDELLALFNVPDTLLPEVKECADDFGITDSALFGEAIPINGVAGDQQAATVGQCCFQEGSIKSTYGTGCFVLLNTGDKVLTSKNNLLSTIAYQINGKVSYALEGSIFIAGAAVQWLRDGIGVIEDARETETMAQNLNYEHGVYMVPAFAGLGAPYWDPLARASIFGMTRATSPDHFARAALESVAYQTFDLLEAMSQDGVTATSINVDGGMVANNWVCQFISDVLNIEVARPEIMETTALGAAYLAGLKAGIYESMDDLAQKHAIERKFNPELAEATRNKLLSGWKAAIQSTLNFLY